MASLRLTAMSGAALSVLAQIGAVAQDADAAGAAPSVREQIVVTATRREETAQTAGVSVSALDARALETRSIQTVEQVALHTPGLHIASYQGDTSVFIRGIGTPVIIAGNDSSTASYVDGVYISRAAAIGPAFFDVSRIEVLRGPQGTLYGRNATGGAVHIVTNRPTEEFEANAEVTVGDYNLRRFSGAISGPLTDNFRVRLAGRREVRDGYTTLRSMDPATMTETVREVEDRDDFSVRLRMEADLSDNLLAGLDFDYYAADDAANVFHYASAGYAEEVPGWYGTREGQQTLPYFGIKNSGRISARASRDLFADVPYFNDTEIWGVTGRLEWDLGGYDMQLIANYRDTQPNFQNEFDLADSYNTYVRRAEDHQQWSVDFQINSPAEGRLSWVAGLQYFEEENGITNNIFGNFWEPILIQGLTDLQAANVIPAFPIVIPSTDLCCELHLSGRQETRAAAAYVDFSYDLTERLTLSLGGRYSWEERDGAQQFELVILNPTPGGPTTRFAPNPALFPNALTNDRAAAQPDPFGFIVAPVQGPATFDAFTPALGLEFQSTENILLYASAEMGFKSGGYNIGSSQLTPFQEEEIWSFEFGAKTEFFDNRLRLNAAAFRYNYTNLQAQDSIGNQTIIRNVGEAEINGFELEGVAAPTDWLQIDGSLTYLDATFTEGSLTEPLRPAPLTQPPGTFLRDLEGLRLPRAPEWSFNIGAEVTAPLQNERFEDISLRVDYAWRDKVYFTVFNIDAASQDAYGVLSARATLNGANDRWSLAVFGDNLTDETYFNNQILTGSVYGAEFVGPLGAPRTWGVQLSTRF